MTKKEHERQTSAENKTRLPPGVKLLRTFRGHNGRINSVAFDPEGETLASASSNGEVILWETRSGRALRTLNAHVTGAMSVAFHPQNKALATGGGDGSVKIWEPDSGKLLLKLEEHEAPVYSVAFNPNGETLASGSWDKTVNIWDVVSGKVYRRLKGHREYVMSIAYDLKGRVLASAAQDQTINLWETASGNLLRTLKGDTSVVTTIAFERTSNTLASGSFDKRIRLWDVTRGKLLRTLEAHTGCVDAVTFSPDGQLLVSKSEDNTIRVFDCKTWETVATIPEPKIQDRWLSALAFHPTLPLLATAGSQPRTPTEERSRLIHLWELDYTVLLDQREETSRSGKSGSWTKVKTQSYLDGHYRNAKVVLVGNTSVGKSGIGLVLAGRKFRATESSHGRRIWSLDAAKSVSTTVAILNPKQNRERGVHETRETLLWDLAGQPGYRLVHQLHLSEAAVALVLFDARSETEPFAGVSYWARALDSARSETFPLTKFLVASRIDRSGPAVSQGRIDQVMKRYGFDGYFETSAKRGDGVKELRDGLRRAIKWNDIPAITRTTEFQITKTFLVRTKRRGKIVEETEVLFNELRKSTSKNRRALRSALTREVFKACLQQLETTGLIRRLSFGDWVLLQPELLDDYCGWLTQAARAEPDGLGFIWEDDALSGRFPMDKDRPLAKGRKKEEQILLLAAVEESLSWGLAIRETAAKERRSLLVFPAELREDLPDYPGGYSLAVRFRFHGPVRGIFASLVVRFIYSMEFEKFALHRNAALFKAIHDGGRICGLAVDYPDIEDDSLGRITVFFDDTARAPAKNLFLQYINSQLKALAFDGSAIEHERVYHCTKDNLTIDPQAVVAARKNGIDVVFCSGCGARFPLDNLVEQSLQDDARVKDIDRKAETGQRLAGLATTIEERQKDGNFDVFLCHNSRDKPAVRELAKDLRDMGLLAWMDEERLLPGDVVQEKLEHAIQQAGAVIVCIGPSGLGRWQSVEYHTVYERFIELSDSEANVGFHSSARLTVIPVVLPGAKTNQIPSFLRRHLYVDLREKYGGATRRELMQKLVTAILGGES